MDVHPGHVADLKNSGALLDRIHRAIAGRARIA